MTRFWRKMVKVQRLQNLRKMVKVGEPLRRRLAPGKSLGRSAFRCGFETRGRENTRPTRDALPFGAADGTGGGHGVRRTAWRGWGHGLGLSCDSDCEWRAQRAPKQNLGEAVKTVKVAARNRD